MNFLKPKGNSLQVVAMRKSANLYDGDRMVLRWEVLQDRQEIACIVENADDYYCGHGQTPEQAMVDLFGKLGAI